MDLWISYFVLMGAILLGAISPGPSFVIVAKTALGSSRADGMAVALGMGIGAVIMALIVLAGLQILLQTIPGLYIALKILGAAYLLYISYRIWRGADKLLVLDAQKTRTGRTLFRSFLLGLGTTLSNPKIVAVYGSIFSALLPPDLPVWMYSLLLPSLFVVETGWYCIVALLLSSDIPRRGYLQAKSKIDRCTAGILSLLGVKLLVGSS